MAFVNRARRSFGHHESNTPELVGPGSYLRSGMDLTVGMRYSVAPFCSTAAKQTLKDAGSAATATPGPGTYQLANSPLRKARARGAVFLSKTDRFRNQKIHNTPGPGEYASPANHWKKRQSKSRSRPRKSARSRRRKKKSVVWVKVDTVPSIPTLRDSHGYDEQDDGSLVKSRSQVVRHDGTKVNCVGPGEYNTRIPIGEPEDSSRIPLPSAAFQSRTGRNVFQGDRSKVVPGPGRYASFRVSQFGAPVNRDDPYKHSSSFASRSKRFSRFLGQKKDEVRDAPGPGHYLSINHSTGFNSRRKPLRHQNFGSSSLRPFAVPDDMKSSHVTPGPGHFHQGNTDFDRVRHRRAMSHGPFLTTADRFGPATAAASPGPGQYPPPAPDKTDRVAVPGQTLVQKVEKRRRTGGWGAFGSTSRRFRSSARADAPAVGQYDPKHPDDIHAPKKDPRSSMFMPPSVKLKKPKPPANVMEESQDPEDGPPRSPGPGSYHAPDPWRKVISERIKDRSFLRKSKRFRVRKTSIPGPGAYDHASAIGAQSASRSKTSFGGQVRFQAEKRIRAREDRRRRWDEHLASPGPGHYANSVDWEKRSFNVTIL